MSEPERETGRGYGDPQGDIAEFHVYRVDDRNREAAMPLTYTQGPRAEALLQIVQDMQHIIEATRVKAADLRLYEIIRVPVDLSVMRMGHA